MIKTISTLLSSAAHRQQFSDSSPGTSRETPIPDMGLLAHHHFGTPAPNSAGVPNTRYASVMLVLLAYRPFCTPAIGAAPGNSAEGTYCWRTRPDVRQRCFSIAGVPNFRRASNICPLGGPAAPILLLAYQIFGTPAKNTYCWRTFYLVRQQ